ncbi:nucleotide excision repair protein [Halalkalibacter wakoensis JCM 9140]|uniref:Nucleotide excision repair protein n=1 Tax=Halalkalibacter wakoensis JCM 9140 TaxID=1236970 RepID=W4Q1R4_9BACI|nr:nucleotide excision repair protein [Halalkalibacter wakoensis JCM 9140]
MHFEQPLKTEAQEVKPSCDKCGMTYEQFTQVGRFGCAHCYKSFEAKLEPILKRVHSGNHKHAGKLPERIGGGIQLQRQIDSLKTELKGLIDQEEFEKAAELRDKIRLLEKQKNEQKEG